MSMNLADAFEALSDSLADREALYFEGARLSYAELDERANKVGHFLESIGIGANDHVAMHMRNSLEFVEGLIGTLKVRAVPVNINFRYTSSELEYLYSNSDSKLIIIDSEFTGVAGEILGGLGELQHVLVVGEVSDAFTQQCSDAGVGLSAWSDVIPDQSPDREFPERSGDDHYMVYTGGTTGHPKGVVWTHTDFYYAALAGGNQYGDPHDTVEELCNAAKETPAMSLLVTAPLIHGAAVYAMFSMFFMGAKQVLMRNWDPVEALRLIGEEKAQIIMIVGDAMGVPFVDELVDNFDAYDVSSLFAVNSGGAIWSQASRDKLKTVLPDIFIRDNFGASESGTDGQLSMNDAGELRLPPSPRSIVIDELLDPVEPGSDTIGYMARVGHVPLEYYKDPEKSANVFKTLSDGRRMSVLGDMAKVESDGSIVLLGRGSGCINTGGEKVFPEEVEQALKGHPAIFDALVAGAKDPKYGERVSAVVSIRDGFEEPSAEELAAHCRKSLAGYKVPRSVVVVPEVLRSPSGKADYRWAKRTVADDATV